MEDYSEYIKTQTATTEKEDEDDNYEKYIKSQVKDKPKKPKTSPQPKERELTDKEKMAAMTPLGQLKRGLQNILQGGTQAGAGLADLAARSYSANPQLAPTPQMGVMAGAKKDEIQKTLGQIIAGSEELEKEKGLGGVPGKVMHQIGAMGVDIPVKYSNPVGLPLMAGEGFIEGGDVTAQDYANKIAVGGGNQTIENKKTLVDALISGGKSTANAIALAGLGKLSAAAPQGIARPAIESAGMAGISATMGDDPVVGAILGAGFGAKKINAPRKPIFEPKVPSKGGVNEKVSPGGEIIRGTEQTPVNTPTRPQESLKKEVLTPTSDAASKNEYIANGDKKQHKVKIVDEQPQVNTGDPLLGDGLVTETKKINDISAREITGNNKTVIKSISNTSGQKGSGTDFMIGEIRSEHAKGNTVVSDSFATSPQAYEMYRKINEAHGIDSANPEFDLRVVGKNEAGGDRIEVFKIGDKRAESFPQFKSEAEAAKLAGKTTDVPSSISHSGVNYPVKGDYIRFRKDGPEYYVEKTDKKRMYLLDTKGLRQDIPINSPVINITSEKIAELEPKKIAKPIRGPEIIAKPEAIKTEAVPPVPEPPKQKISQVVNAEPTKSKPNTVGTFTKEFGKETALKLSEGFAEYTPSIRKEQKIQAAEELMRDGIEKSSQDLVNKKTPWDDYDAMKANEIRRSFIANAKSTADLDNPLLKGIMRRSKEVYSDSAKIVQAAATVDPVTDPIRAAEVKLAEQIDKTPHIRRQKAKAEATTKRVQEVAVGINKKALEKNLDSITLNVSKLLRKEMKADGIKLRDIIRKHYTEINSTGESLAQKIMRGLDINEHDAQIAERWIADSFGVLTNAAKKRVLDNMLAGGKKTPAETDVVKKILELSNLGAMDDARFADVIARRMGVPELTPEHMFELSKQSQKIQAMPDKTRADNDAIIDEVGKLYSMLYTDTPKTATQKAMDFRALSMLFNLKSAERNVAGQGGDTVVTSIAKSVFGVPADRFMTKMLSKRIGTPQERTMGHTEFKQLFRDIFKAWKYGNADVKKNIDTLKPRLEKEFGIVLGKEADKFGLGKPEWKPGSVGEKVQKGVAYLLQAPDRAFQEAVFRESYNNQLKALGLSARNNVTAEMRNKMARQAWREASTMTYRKMNAFSNMIVGLQQKMGTIGKLILTFPKVASNILYSGLYQYGPVGLGVTANRMRKFIKSGGVEIEPKRAGDLAINQRQLAFDFARGGIGTALVATGVLAGYTAAATGGLDDDANERKTREYLGEQPGAVRIGNHYYRWDWAQPISIPLELGVEIGRALRKKKDTGFAENAINVLTSAATSIVDQPLFTTFKRMTSVPGEKGGEKLLGAGEALVSSSASSFIPTAFGQARQLVDRYQRNVYNKYGKGSVNELRAWMYNAGAMMVNKIPFASNLLEERRDIFGNKMVYHQSGNFLFDLLDRFANPSIMTDAKKDPGIQFILQLNEDRPEGMKEKPLPRVTERTWYIESEGKRYYMTPKQRAKYQELVGKDAHDYIQEYYNNGYGDGVPTVDTIKDIYNSLGDIGKARREEMLEELSSE